MRPDPARRATGLALVLAVLAIAPAPPETPPKPSPLAEARFQSAQKQFQEIWTYYKQSRTDSFLTYYWSRLVLDAQQDLSAAKADRIAAIEAHLDRMKRLEELVKKVRRLGFGYSIDIGATEYYRLEAQRWLEKARES